MIFQYEGGEINTNLGGECFNSLINGDWKIGFISENPELLDTSSNYYVKSNNNSINKVKESSVHLKNKINLKLIDNSTIYGHIIHIVPSGNYFCVDTNSFWDQFEIN
tara:strand:+ start:1907 stop:2227 length:321 start_codon:yes stop_codon:yes gene_type:complete